MERRSGVWIASTPERQWSVQRRPITTRKSEVNLRFDGRKYQFWEGFGGGISERGWEALNSLKGGEQRRALFVLSSHEEGCRFHYGRVPVGASNLALSEHSCNDTPNDLAMKRFSTTRDQSGVMAFLRMFMRGISGFEVVACPWSPPEWMKEQGGSDCGRITWTPILLESYAFYLVRFVQAYRQAGIAVDHLLIQNEPASGKRRPGCLWTGAQLRDFIRTHLGPMFSKQKLPTTLWLGALEADHCADYLQTVWSDPKARQFLSGIACQHGTPDVWARIRRAFPDITMMQSDCGEGDGGNTWEQGHNTFSRVQQAIAGGAGMCLYENLVFPLGGKDLEGRGRNSLLVTDRASQTFTLTPDYYVFRHLSCLTDRYAIRLGLDGEWASRAVVFFNREDKSRVLVIHNPEQEPRRVVLEDYDRLLAMVLQPQSFNTVVV